MLSAPLETSVSKGLRIQKTIDAWIDVGGGSCLPEQYELRLPELTGMSAPLLGGQLIEAGKRKPPTLQP